MKTAFASSPIHALSHSVSLLALWLAGATALAAPVYETTFDAPATGPTSEEVKREPLKSETAPAQSQKNVTLTVSSEIHKCTVCMGKIKPGFNLYKCGCGVAVHEMCGRRIGKCPGCGAEFD